MALKLSFSDSKVKTTVQPREFFSVVTHNGSSDGQIWNRIVVSHPNNRRKIIHDKTLVQIFDWSVNDDKPPLKYTKLFSSITEAYKYNIIQYTVIYKPFIMKSDSNILIRKLEITMPYGQVCWVYITLHKGCQSCHAWFHQIACFQLFWIKIDAIQIAIQ